MDKLFGQEKIISYFAFEGHKKVEGWLSSHTLSFLYHLNRIQEKSSIRGNVAEIGVFKGKFFIALCLMMHHGEKAVAVDVFNEQHLNLDNSGVGDLEQFTNNVTTALGNFSDVSIIQSDSIKVTSGQILESVGGGIRLFSIDGCHTAEHTASDLHLAERCVVPGGIVILDDFENASWPGVLQGTEKFLAQSANLRPFAIAYNKLYLTTADHVSEYCSFAKEAARESTSDISHEKVCGFDVQRVLMPAVETIFPDAFIKSIDFSSNASPGKYLGRGWSTPEPWGVWSEQDTADLDIALPSSQQPLTMIVTYHAFVTASRPEAKITVRIDGEQVDEILFKIDQDYQNWAYRLPSNAADNGASLHISFTVASPKSPFELGLSADHRKLGIGLRNIRFSTFPASTRAPK